MKNDGSPMQKLSETKPKWLFKVNFYLVYRYVLEMDRKEIVEFLSTVMS